MRTRYMQLVTAQRQVRDQQRWIADHGGTIEGYVERYGAADDPDKYGDGGEAIWKADTEALARYESALIEAQGRARNR